MLEMWIDPESPYAKEYFQTGNKFIFFCAGAWRSALATKTAKDMGLLPVAHLDSHASYIEHWLKLLKSDDRAILTAAAKAEEAASLLLKLGGRARADAADLDDDSDADGVEALAA